MRYKVTRPKLDTLQIVVVNATDSTLVTFTWGAVWVRTANCQIDITAHNLKEPNEFDLVAVILGELQYDWAVFSVQYVIDLFREHDITLVE